jgi:hypothetical protein
MPGAITGGISGGITGGFTANSSNKNIWWGGEFEKGRTKWSFNPKEKEKVIYLKSSNYNGDVTGAECWAFSMAEIDKRYTAPQWQDIYNNYLDNGKTVEELFKDYNIDYKSIKYTNELKGSDIENIVNKGYDKGTLSVDNYYNTKTKTYQNHNIKLNEIRYTSKYFKVSGLDWGAGDQYPGGTYTYKQTYRLDDVSFKVRSFNFFK